jgi:hypothetical protein
MSSKIVCIFCKKNENDGRDHKLTDEHIIPEVIGGWITIPFVCKKCNNNLGSEFESKLKKNSFVVTAIDELKIQPPDKAFNQAQIELIFSDEHKAKGRIAKDGLPIFIPTQQADGSIIANEQHAKEVLKKQIERYEKANNVRIDFDINTYDNVPYGIVIPIMGTDINFIKHEKKKAQTTILNLSEPIPFLFPAKVAFEHLAGFSYHFVMMNEFDSLRNWVLENNLQNKVIINTLLHRIENPREFEYLPYHFIRYSIIENDLVALVGLFGSIIFSVYLAHLSDLENNPILKILDVYHVYDLKNKELVPQNPPKDVFEEHSSYMDGIRALANYYLSQSS